MQTKNQRSFESLRGLYGVIFTHYRAANFVDSPLGYCTSTSYGIRLAKAEVGNWRVPGAVESPLTM